jgi:hypothetical protein
VAAEGEKLIWYNMWVDDVLLDGESVMSHQYKAGDVVTVFQLSRSKELVIEGKATIRKRSQMLMSSTGSSSPISQA